MGYNYYIFILFCHICIAYTVKKVGKGHGQLISVASKQMCVQTTADQQDEFSLEKLQLLVVVAKHLYKNC